MSVSPPVDTVIAADTVRLSVTLRDSSSNLLSGRSVVFSSSNTGIATVNGAGLVTGVSPGLATITATSEGRQGSADVMVGAQLRIGVILPSLFAGDTLHLNLRVTDRNNVTLPAAPVIWETSSAAIGTVVNGVVTGQNAGLVTITARSGASSESVVVAVVAPRPAVNRGLVYVDAEVPHEGMPIARLLSLDPSTGDTANLIPPGSAIFYLAWSADGNNLALYFEAGTDPRQTRSGLWVRDQAGGMIQIHATGGTQPSWLPDGSGLLYVVRSGGVWPQIWRSSIGGAPVQLTNRPAGTSDRDPQVSPDGRQFIYSRDGELYSENLSTRAERQVFPSPVTISNARWSPDGKWIAFQEGADGSARMVVVNPSVSTIRLVSPNCTPGAGCASGATFGVPTWSPDGRRLFFQSSFVGSSGLAEVTIATGAIRILPQQLPCRFELDVSPDQEMLAAGCGGTLPFVITDSDGTTPVSYGNAVYLQRWRP